MFIKTLTLVLTSLLLCGPVYAQILSGGETLKTAIGARQTGMSEAFTALSGDVAAMYYNPAGLAKLTSPEITTMYTANLFENQNALIAFGMPVPFYGSNTLSIGLMNLAGAPMDIYYPDGTTETRTSQNDLITTVGIARQLSTSFSVGFNLKFFYSSLIEEYTALAFGCDLGTQYAFAQLPGLTLGAALQHLGTEIKYEDEGDPMPTTLRIGAAYAWLLGKPHTVTISTDALLPNDSEPLQNIGLEYNWQNTLFIRGGYKLGYDIDAFSIGAGIVFSGLKLDYAFSSTQLELAIHRVSLAYSFAP
ncbi:PorV/PorQ family protein [bacterium]|nr:PorV/PorQ family protein [bacterium]